jgi:hypothetical protein
MPDLEHVLPWLRPGGRKLFHWSAQQGGGVSADTQLLLAGAAVGWLLGRALPASLDT